MADTMLVSKVVRAPTPNPECAGSSPGSSPGPPAKRQRLSSPEPTNPEPTDPDTDPDTVYVRSVGVQCSRPLRVVMCVVCGLNEAEHVFVPCGHRKVCLSCLVHASEHACSNETLSEVGYRNGFHKDCKCPMCRAVVREVVVLYE